MGESKISNNSTERRQEFAGTVLKCPNCGEPITQTTAICPQCGMKITGQAAVTSVTAFSKQLMAIEATRKNGLGAMFGWRTLLVVLALSVIVQVILFLPIFIRGLVQNKDWKTLISFVLFCAFAITFYSLQHFRIITIENVLIFSIGAIILAALGIVACILIFKGLRENPENRTYLPFGPAMVIAAFAALLL